MTVEDVSGAVTICKRGRTGLYADDLGVSVLGSKSGGARFAWAEIDRFADGCSHSSDYYWVLVIVLHTGQKVPVYCTRGRGGAAPETLAAIRQVADRHEITADLTGVPMADDGRPVRPNLFEDPGGQAGLRYWDGTQWSPLIPRHLWKARWKGDTTLKSAGFWSDFPAADGRWNYAAVRARRWTVRFACAAAVTVALLTAGLWWDHGSTHRHADGGWWFIGAMFALVAAGVSWWARTFFHKVDELSRGSVDPER